VGPRRDQSEEERDDTFKGYSFVAPAVGDIVQKHQNKNMPQTLKRRKESSNTNSLPRKRRDVAATHKPVWKVGVIEELFQGSDAITRVVMVRTPLGS
jgi:hypothetical protein